MRAFKCISASFLLAAALLLLTGCPSNSGSDADSDSDHAGHDDGGDHGHSHDAPGPAGGHVLAIGDEEYHVEWVHDEDDEGAITFIVRDDQIKEEVPIAADHLLLEFIAVDETGKQTTREVEVPAVRDEEETETARFELTDNVAVQNLLGGSEDVTTVLKLTIDGIDYQKEIEHAAHGHGHSHSH